MDKLDRKLLDILSNDCKTPYAEIAREMKLSRAAITKRVNALIAKDVIQRFTLTINPKSLGLDIEALFEISTMPARTQGIMDELTACKETGRIILTDATSLFVTAYFRDSKHLNEFLMKEISMKEGVNDVKTNIVLAESSGQSMVESKRP